jgi:hypothetical protein
MCPVIDLLSASFQTGTSIAIEFLSLIKMFFKIGSCPGTPDILFTL